MISERKFELTMEENRSISVVRKGNLESVRELIVSLGLPFVKEGYNLLLVALEENRIDVAKLLLTNGPQVNSNEGYSTTPLHCAATHDDVEIVKMLLDRNAKVEAKDANFQSPLHHAVENNRNEIVQLLLSRGAYINAHDKNGITPLHIACKKNYVGIVEMLLNCGASVNHTTYLTYKQDICGGYTPLHYATQLGSRQITQLLLKSNANINVNALHGTPLHIAVKAGYRQIALDLLDHGALVNSECMSTGYTPLHLASANGDTEVVMLLLTRGADVKAVAKDNLTPLYLATEKGHQTTVQLLLEHGADIDAQNKHGETVLFQAVSRGHLRIAKDILKFCPDRSNESNSSCLKQAIYLGNLWEYQYILEYLLDYGFAFNWEDIYDKRLVHSAIMHGCLDIAEHLLYYGANVNMRSNAKGRYTLLHRAMFSRKKMEAVKLLLKYGADVNTKDTWDKAPIFYAIEDCNWKITKLLLAKGAKTDDPDLLITAVKKGSKKIVEILLQCNSDIDVDGRDSLGRTALYCTVLDDEDDDFRDKAEMAKLLLDRGASANIRTRDGTALHAAIRIGCVEVVKALLEYNADVNALVEDVTPLHISFERGTDGAEVNSRSHAVTTPLHLAVHSGFSETVEVLIEFGADVNSIDAYGRTALHIAFRGIHTNTAIALLRNGSDINITSTLCDLPCIHSLRRELNFEQCNFDSENAKVIVSHIAQLKAKNFFVNEVYLQTVDNKPNLKQYYISCEREIKKMKTINLLNTDVSFYDILTKREHQLAMYARNKNIVKGFKSSDYVKMFPIYADLLENRLEKGQQRKYLLKSSLKSASSVFGNKLPYLFIDQMFSYLSNLDLWHLIDACPY